MERGETVSACELVLAVLFTSVLYSVFRLPAVLQVHRCVGSSVAGLGAEFAPTELVTAVALQGAEPPVS